MAIALANPPSVAIPAIAATLVPAAACAAVAVVAELAGATVVAVERAAVVAAEAVPAGEAAELAAAQPAGCVVLASLLLLLPLLLPAFVLPIGLTLLYRPVGRAALI